MPDGIESLRLGSSMCRTVNEGAGRVGRTIRTVGAGGENQDVVPTFDLSRGDERELLIAAALALALDR